MKKILLMSFLILFSATVFGQNLKVKQSEIQWKAYKALNSDAFSHYGTVQLKAGDVTVNKSRQITGGNFILDMKTIVADDMKGDRQKIYLENHLKSDDFFDVDNYPTVFFKIVSVKNQPGKGTNSIVTGNLTIRKTTKTISFPANITWEGNTLKFVSGDFSFNRQDFGLTYNVFEDMIIRDEVEMHVKFSAK